MLLERIEADLAQSRRRRDGMAGELLAVICTVCETRSKAIRPKRALTDDEVKWIVRATLTQLETASTRNRKAEALLRAYLPKSLTDQDIEQIAVRQHRIMPLPGIMAYLKKNYFGMYDPARAIVIVRKVTT